MIVSGNGQPLLADPDMSVMTASYALLPMLPLWSTVRPIPDPAISANHSSKHGYLAEFLIYFFYTKYNRKQTFLPLQKLHFFQSNSDKERR